MEAMEIRADIDSWREDQAIIMPEVGDLVCCLEVDHVESELLYMPSQLPEELRQLEWFKQLSEIELELRKGSAYDAINNLRVALRYRASVQSRQRKAQSQTTSTRAAAVLNSAHLLVDRRSAWYRRVRDAMLSLGLEPTDQTFRPLLQEDVSLKNPFTYKERGDGRKLETWIWTMGQRHGDQDEWEDEGRSFCNQLATNINYYVNS